MKPASAELCMPEELRNVLSRPWLFFRSTVLEGPREFVGLALRTLVERGSTVFVGDVVCRTVLEYVGVPRMCVVDARTLRSEESCVDPSMFDLVDRCTNRRSTVSLECIAKEIRLLDAQTSALLLVDGEEDLLALPLVALNVVDVVFGIPTRGVCIVWSGVDNAVKAINALSRFANFDKLGMGSLS